MSRTDASKTWSNPLAGGVSPVNVGSSSKIGESSTKPSGSRNLPVNPYARYDDRGRSSHKERESWAYDRSDRYREEDRGRGERSRDRREEGYIDDYQPNKRPRHYDSPERDTKRDSRSRHSPPSQPRYSDRKEEHHRSSRYDDDRRYDDYRSDRHRDERDDRYDRYDSRGYHDRYDRRDKDRYDDRGGYSRDKSRYEEKSNSQDHRSPHHRSSRRSDPAHDHRESSSRHSPSRRRSSKARSPSPEDGEIDEEEIPSKRPATPPLPPPPASPPRGQSRKLTMKNRPSIESSQLSPPPDTALVEDLRPPKIGIAPPDTPPPPPTSVPPPPSSAPPSPPDHTPDPDASQKENVAVPSKVDKPKDRILSRHPSTISLGPGCPVKFRRPTEEQEKEMYDRTFIGTRRLAAYTLGETLGEGTFGIVKSAAEKATKRRVALKQLLVHNPRDGVSLTTVREVKLLKSLNHKNVVPILDMVVEPIEKGSKAGRQEVYMVFPYMKHDLCGLLSNPKFRLSPSIAKSFTKQLLEGMAYIHANNIIHRDIKTANILVDEVGQIMIADFGLARPISNKPLPPHLEDELTNMVVTRWYRAPELLLGDTKYGPAIDMWSIGCIIGEMYRKAPILPGGPNDVDQLYEIFSRCGPLTEESFPGWKQLPGHPGHENTLWDLKVHPMPSLQMIASKEWGMEKGGIDLMMKLLKYDPKVRLSAEDALDHVWLHVSPKPQAPKNLGVDSSHELTAKKEERQAAAVAAAPAARPSNNRGPPAAWSNGPGGPGGFPQQRPSWAGNPNNPYGGPPPGPNGQMPMSMQNQMQGGMGMGMGMGMQNQPNMNMGRMGPQGQGGRMNGHHPQHQPGYPAQQPYQNGPMINHNTNNNNGPLRHAPPSGPAGSRHSTSIPAPPFTLKGQSGPPATGGSTGPPMPPFKLAKPSTSGSGMRQPGAPMNYPPSMNGMQGQGGMGSLPPGARWGQQGGYQGRPPPPGPPSDALPYD